MTKLMLIDAQHDGETRVIITDNDQIADFDFITSSKKQIKSNIYLAKVTRVEPSLQAAFVEYGGNKQGFLPFSEIHPDYYQIPADDKERLLKEEAAEAAEEEAREEAEEEEKEQSRSRGGRNRRRRGANRRDKEVKSDETYEDDSEEAKAESTEETADADAVEAKESEAETAENKDEASEKPKAKDAKADDAAADSDDDADADDDSDEEEAETLGGDDVDDTRSDNRKRQAHRRYNIQEVIKRNQIMLVQVIKEERGNKGCSMSSYISLPGRYCVLMPNSHKGGGVSRKITGREDRKRLKEIMGELKEKYGMNAIIRTAGSDKSKPEVRRDFDYLIKLWNQIREDTMQATAPALIYEEGDVIKRMIRDSYTADIEEVLVDGEDAYKDAKGFMKMLMPSHAARVKKYKGDIPLFYEYEVEQQLDAMYEPEVRLPSGGSIVIHPTEALISIDVNSGRSTSERNVEETAVKTNCEAAEEVARQLRLRDLAGLVVIDFIDMYQARNRKTVERVLKNALKVDRAKIQLSRLSMFGLMELSRQRLRANIAETTGITCPSCHGMGFIRSDDTTVIQLVRIIEKEASSGDFKEFRVYTNTDIALHMLNHKKDVIQQVEQQYGVTITVMIDHTLNIGAYRIIKVRQDGSEIGHDETKANKNRRRGGKNRKRSNKGRNRDDESADNDSDNNDSEENTSDAEVKKSAPKEGDDSDSDDDDKPRRRRRRGGRGRRGGRNRNREGEENSDGDESGEATENKSDNNTDTSDAKPDNAEPKEVAKTETSDAPKAKEDAPEASKEEVKEEKKPTRRRSTKKTASLEVEDSKEDPTAQAEPKEKRAGWWNKVVG